MMGREGYVRRFLAAVRAGAAGILLLSAAVFADELSLAASDGGTGPTYAAAASWEMLFEDNFGVGKNLKWVDVQGVLAAQNGKLTNTVSGSSNSAYPYGSFITDGRVSVQGEDNECIALVFRSAPSLSAPMAFLVYRGETLPRSWYGDEYPSAVKHYLPIPTGLVGTVTLTVEFEVFLVRASITDGVRTYTGQYYLQSSTGTFPGAVGLYRDGAYGCAYTHFDNFIVERKQ